MNEEQREHILKIVDRFKVLAYDKYEKGVEEHGGNLWEKDPRWLAREVRAEAIDQFVYIHDLITWVDRLVDRITELEAENKRLKSG